MTQVGLLFAQNHAFNAWDASNEASECMSGGEIGCAAKGHDTIAHLGPDRGKACVGSLHRAHRLLQGIGGFWRQ